jgi:hypothetical protein
VAHAGARGTHRLRAYAVILGIGFGIEAATQETVCLTDTSGLNLGDVCATGNSTLGVAAVLVSALAGLA